MSFVITTSFWPRMPKKRAPCCALGRSHAFFNLSRSVVVNPGRLPALRSSSRTHFLSVSGVQPSFVVTDTIAAYCDSCVSCCSNTSRTARSRISAGYLLCSIAPSSQG
jgi:hypothetical protein